jgi:hypothetical protein
MAAENAVLESQSVAGVPVEGTGEVAPPEGVSPMSDCHSRSVSEGETRRARFPK